jgi:hypothetical protein
MSKFYRLHWTDANQGRLLSWAANKKDANIRKREILSEYKNKPKDYQQPVIILEVDIPTDKGGLSRWLDRNFNKDNG